MLSLRKPSFALLSNKIINLEFQGMFNKHLNKRPSQAPIPFSLKCLSNFVHSAFEDCPISDKMYKSATNYLYWSNVGDDRKFVKINSFFTSGDWPMVTKMVKLNNDYFTIFTIFCDV